MHIFFAMVDQFDTALLYKKIQLELNFKKFKFHTNFVIRYWKYQVLCYLKKINKNLSKKKIKKMKE